MSYFSKNIKAIILMTAVCAASITAVFAQEPSETPPPPSDPPSLSIPEVKEMTLANGLKVVAVPRRDIPLVTVSLLVKSGANAEAENKAGLANLTADLLTKGTEFRTATDIAQQIEFLGGSINSGAGWNSSTVTVNVMRDKLGKALSIMSDSVIRPSFPAKEIALLKKQTVDGLNVGLKQPGTILSFVASRYAFGEHSTAGTPQTIQRLGQTDVMKFHNNYYLPNNSVLIFTGDISEDQAFRFAKLFFGAWKEGNPVNQKMEMSEQDRQSGSSIVDKILVIDLPDSGQAAVGYNKKLINGRIACTESNTDLECVSSKTYYPASVLNSILGGGYSARLNQEIRLKRGLSYGAGSGFDWRNIDTNFNAVTQTKNESAAEVAELIKIEIERLINDSVEEDELVPRKAVVTGGFGRSLQSNNGLAARLRDIYLYGLNPNELNSYLTNVNNVTDNQIKDFAEENLSGGDIIIVGDARMFMDDLKKRFPDKAIETIKISNLDLNKAGLKKR